MSNGDTIQQRILHFLTDFPKEAFTKETIATQVTAKVGAVAKDLTALKKAERVQENNGKWSTTQKGVELYSTNPNFTPFHTREAANSRENWWEQILDEIGLEYITTSHACKFLYENRDAPELETLDEYIKAIAFAWVMQYLPNIHLVFEPDNDNIPRDNIVMKIIRDLMQEIEPPKQEQTTSEEIDWLSPNAGGLPNGYEYVREEGEGFQPPKKREDGWSMIRKVKS